MVRGLPESGKNGSFDPVLANDGDAANLAVRQAAARLQKSRSERI
jgi:hypothetical protein